MFEFPYIIQFCKDFYQPDLTEEEIWEISILSEKFVEFYKEKTKTINFFEKLKTTFLSRELSLFINNVMIPELKDDTDLSFFKTYLLGLELIFDNSKNKEILIPEFSKFSRTIIENTKDYILNIERFKQICLMENFNFCKNLNLLLNNQPKIHMNLSKNPDESPNTVISEMFPDFKDDEQKFLEKIGKYITLYLFNYPPFKKTILKALRLISLFTVELTEKGNAVLNIFHKNFKIKNLENFPYSSFTEDLFLRVFDEEQKGNLKIKINFEDNLQELKKKLIFCYNFNSSNNNWNLFREKLVNYLIEFILEDNFLDLLKYELKEKAELYVVKKSASELSKTLMYNPNKNLKSKSAENYLFEEVSPTIMSIIFDSENNTIYSSNLNEYGQIEEIFKFKISVDFNLKTWDNNFDNKMKKLLVNYSPEIIVIGFDDVNCFFIKDIVYNIIEKMKIESKLNFF